MLQYISQCQNCELLYLEGVLYLEGMRCKQQIEFVEKSFTN